MVLCAGSIAAIKFNRSERFQIFLSMSEAMVAIALFIDSMMAITKSNLSGGLQVRFAVFLRPILVMLWSTRVQEIISEVLEACRSLKYMAILILFWLLISSLFFVQMLRAECGFGDGDRAHLFPESIKESCNVLMQYYDNSLLGFVAVFILSTGEMYTVITLPIFDMPEPAFEFFVVILWTIVTYFILMSIVLAIVFNAYKDAKLASLVHRSDLLDGCLMDAFDLIADPQNCIITFDVYSRFLEYFQVSILSPLNCNFECQILHRAAWNQAQNCETVLEQPQKNQGC
jgi:hypothetical protein